MTARCQAGGRSTSRCALRHGPLLTPGGGGSWHLTCQPPAGLGPKGAPDHWPPGSLGLRLCHLHPQPFFTDECKFKEILLPNNYNAYECYRYPGMFVALSKNGKTKKGNRVSPTMKVTHFLPRL